MLGMDKGNLYRSGFNFGVDYQIGPGTIYAHSQDGATGLLRDTAAALTEVCAL